MANYVSTARCGTGRWKWHDRPGKEKADTPTYCERWRAERGLNHINKGTAWSDKGLHMNQAKQGIAEEASEDVAMASSNRVDAS